MTEHSKNAGKFAGILKKILLKSVISKNICITPKKKWQLQLTLEESWETIWD